MLSKLEWAKDSRSELQLNDVRNLLHDGPTLDMIYMMQWAAQLGVDGLLGGQVMNDATPDVDALFRSMLLQRSGEQRLRMACSMFDTAKVLATASIREKQPDISQADLRRALFLRFYGREFSPTKRELILAAISRSAP